MPNVRSVTPTDHDHHDSMLVAALAADDLAGTDRDQALGLIGSCSDCAALHDDLQAIARATATVPPPLSGLTRDFRITPEQAGRLKPKAWRRILRGLAIPPAIAAPLGVGLATFGLFGLLIGNLSLGGSAASAPMAASGGAAPAGAAGQENGPARASAVTDVGVAGEFPSAAASSAPNAPAASAAAASAGAAASNPGGYVAGLPTVPSSGGGTLGSVPGASGGTGPTSLTGASAEPTTKSVQGSDSEPTARDVAPSPIPLQTILLVAVIVVGLGLLVLSRLGRPKQF